MKDTKKSLFKVKWQCRQNKKIELRLWTRDNQQDKSYSQTKVQLGSHLEFNRFNDKDPENPEKCVKERNVATSVSLRRA